MRHHMKIMSHALQQIHVFLELDFDDSPGTRDNPLKIPPVILAPKRSALLFEIGFWFKKSPLSETPEDRKTGGSRVGSGAKYGPRIEPRLVVGAENPKEGKFCPHQRRSEVTKRRVHAVRDRVQVCESPEPRKTRSRVGELVKQEFEGRVSFYNKMAHMVLNTDLNKAPNMGVQDTARKRDLSMALSTAALDTAPNKSPSMGPGTPLNRDLVKAQNRAHYAGNLQLDMARRNHDLYGHHQNKGVPARRNHDLYGHQQNKGVPDRGHQSDPHHHRDRDHRITCNTFNRRQPPRCRHLISETILPRSPQDNGSRRLSSPCNSLSSSGSSLRPCVGT
ncbi:hypothetical protein R1sor_016702 [Riccia sorocarpa]|uniref:Uncharacterized protein n=1 Tax=Riccia sorocarpa TaxID=122646 RepID=A0ABD3HFQ0_9MARC